MKRCLPVYTKYTDSDSYHTCTNGIHTCHKLWTKICEIRQNFKGDLTKFCEIFLNITLELPIYSLKSFVSCKKLVKTTTMCNLCLQ